MKTILFGGKLIKAKDEEKADFKIPTGSDTLSLTTNLIPGVGGVNGARVLIGDKATVQAISLVNRQAPLAQSAETRKGPSFEEKIGKELLSIQAKEDGVVSYIDDDEIRVKERTSERIYWLYQHFNSGRKTYYHHIPKVKVGDRVRKGDLLAVSNYTDDKGVLALGTNLKTAIMPMRGWNFEDAYALTETGAKKLEAEQLFPVRLDLTMGAEANKAKFTGIFPGKFTTSQLTNIDDDGVVKKGSKVKKGDPLILAVMPKSLRSTDIQLGRLSKLMRGAYRDVSEVWEYEHDGEVVDAVKTGSLITVNVKSRRGMGVGDKISTVFAAKGVVNIIPDSQAPTTEDGKPVDLILNSMSITSRVAPALPVAMAVAKVAEKIGKPLKMTPFVEGNAAEKAAKLLEKHGLKDKEKLYDPITGRELEAFVGPLYVNRLVHISEDKLSGRGEGLGYTVDEQPARGGEEGAKRIGNLSTTSLLSHGATNVLEDIATVRASRNDEFWQRLKLGLPAPAPKVPFVFQKFLANLTGAGVNVKHENSIVEIMPQTDKDILALSSGPIENPAAYKLKKNELIPEPGGLFDPAKTGLMGERYNHIDLNHPVPNPISEEYLRKLLGMTKQQFEAAVKDGSIKTKLEQVNIDAELEKTKKEAKEKKGVAQENAIKVHGFLKMLKEKGLKPADLILTKIPVLPAKFRPVVMQGGMVMPADVNNLYRDLMLINQNLKDSAALPEDVKNELKENEYKAVKAVFGLGDPVSKKSADKNMKGLLSSTLGIRGGSAKTTMFHSKVVNKPIDLVGRAVLTPDAQLDLNEAYVPQDLLWKTYAPFVIRRLVKRGVDAVQAHKMVEARSGMANQALQEEIKDRPAIISRDPALHKYNLTGFYLKPNPDPKDTSVKLNPLVFKPFGADSDGDQLGISVPAGEAAKEEVKQKMLPSQNIINPKNFKPAYVPSNEAALGLFQASIEDNKNTPIKFKSEQEVIDAFQKGKLAVGDRVEIE